MKKIELTTDEAKLLVETLFRGLAYTDMYYRDGTSKERLFRNVVKQLEEQGGQYDMNGKIKFKKKNDRSKK